LVIVLMGVAGAGKTTVGVELARGLGWAFHDADDHHPAANREKMRRGEPLTDADRAPWLERLGALVRSQLESGDDAVLACSALGRRSRELLGRGAPGLVFVHLRGPAVLVRERLERRTGHYFPAALLDSQLAALEPPEGALEVSIEPPPEAIASEIRQRLGL
jgi:gluconokinase